MDAALMAQKLLDARREWLELDTPPRRALRLQRLSALQLSQWRSGVGEAGGAAARMPELLRLAVVGWRGFTEADLLGAAIGASSEQPFSFEVFQLWCADDIDLLTRVSQRIFAMAQEHAEAAGAASGN